MFFMSELDHLMNLLSRVCVSLGLRLNSSFTFLSGNVILMKMC